MCGCISTCVDVCVWCVPTLSGMDLLQSADNSAGRGGATFGGGGGGGKEIETAEICTIDNHQQASLVNELTGQTTG